MKTKFDPESSVEQKLEKQENSTITERSMQLKSKGLPKKFGKFRQE